MSENLYSYAPFADDTIALPPHKAESPGSVGDYMLEIRQQPRQARVALGKDKNRKPIDPPPILQLKVSYRKDPKQHFLQSPYFFMSCSLLKGDEMAGKQPLPSNLLGTVVSSLHRLKDTDNKHGGFFVFGDLSCKVEGKFRLLFTLYQMQKTGCVYITSAVSDIFQVFPSKSFPGLAESTYLTRSFSDQGVRLRLRKDSRSLMTRKRNATALFSRKQQPLQQQSQQLQQEQQQQQQQQQQKQQHDYRKQQDLLQGQSMTAGSVGEWDENSLDSPYGGVRRSSDSGTWPESSSTTVSTTVLEYSSHCDNSGANVGEIGGTVAKRRRMMDNDNDMVSMPSLTALMTIPALSPMPPISTVSRDLNSYGVDTPRSAYAGAGTSHMSFPVACSAAYGIPTQRTLTSFDFQPQPPPPLLQHLHNQPSQHIAPPLLPSLQPHHLTQSGHFDTVASTGSNTSGATVPYQSPASSQHSPHTFSYGAVLQGSPSGRSGSGGGIGTTYHQGSSTTPTSMCAALTTGSTSLAGSPVGDYKKTHPGGGGSGSVHGAPLINPPMSLAIPRGDTRPHPHEMPYNIGTSPPDVGTTNYITADGNAAGGHVGGAGGAGGDGEFSQRLGPYSYAHALGAGHHRLPTLDLQHMVGNGVRLDLGYSEVGRQSGQ